MTPHRLRMRWLSREHFQVAELCAALGMALGVGLWIRGRFLAAMAASTDGADLAEQGWLVQLIAFLWIFGIQTAVVCILLLRGFHSRQAEMRSQQEDTASAARELVRTRDAVIFGLAKLSESRDPETGRHLERISMYSIRLASALRNHPKYRNQITASFIRNIGVSSVLHDIGKVGVPDAILNKPGKLTPAEREEIQTHTERGAECIRDIERQMGDSEFLRMAKEIAMSHHEWWNGTGYPLGLKGERIPLSARIVAIADVYDALAVNRCYKDAYPHEECVALIRQESGTHFDPTLVEVFLTIESDFRIIARRFAAEHSPRDLMTPEQEKIISTLLERDTAHESVMQNTAG